MNVLTVALLGLSFLFSVPVLADRAGGHSEDPRYIRRAQRPPLDLKVPVGSDEIKIMTYNVENLFDTEHDPNKDDYEFLPINHAMKSECKTQGIYKKQCLETDWTPERLELKFRQIKRMIEAQGSLPDLIGLQEVENERVVGLLADRLGYKSFVMTNSPDKRGIDVALLYKEDKLRYIGHSEREVRYPGLATRNLLAVNFAFQNPYHQTGKLGIFVNHWPSQGKETAARTETAKQVKKLVNEMAASQGRKYHAILLGDFNTINGDRPNPINQVILDASWKMEFEDVQNFYESLKLKDATQMPEGSYFFTGEGTWNRLDHIFISKTLYDGSGLEAIPESFRILNPDFATRAYEYTKTTTALYGSVIFGIPMRYEHNTSDENAAGFSDHFPVLMKLKIN